MSLIFYKISSPVVLSYINATGPITISPPINAEVNVASVSLNVQYNQKLKIDYALNIVATTAANWSISFQLRLYRDGTLINTRYYSRVGSQSGDQYIPMSSTYVDTAPVSSASSTYVLKAIVTAETNVSPVKTGAGIDMNIIAFP